MWDFCSAFSGSGHDNGHVVLLWVRQSTCQEWSRLITVLVKVGGPLVTPYRHPYLFPPFCVFWRRKRSKELPHPSFAANHLFFFSVFLLLRCVTSCSLGMLPLCVCRHLWVKPYPIMKVDGHGHRVSYSRFLLTGNVHTDPCVCVCEEAGMQISYSTR